MTVLTDLKAISLTTTAKNAVSAKGADIGVLVTTAQQHVVDLQILMKQIITHHPSGGGDAANYAALGAVLAQLV